MNSRTCVRAIVLKDNSLLTMRRDKFGLRFQTLVGGGVDIGEDAETALRRELREETGLEVGGIRLVWIEDAGELYGEQHIYLCEYVGGEPQLATASEEAAISKLGNNLYLPGWLPVSDLPETVFRSDSVKQALLSALSQGFPETPQRLAWKPESVGQ